MSATKTETGMKRARYGMVIDLDRCVGCGSCMMACAVENNVPPARSTATDRTGLTWIRVYKLTNGKAFPEGRTAFLPLPCQQCDSHPPCESVCPQVAVELDQKTGIVFQMPQRCLGCRYCMTACPYHARYFNWFDPVWPKGMEKTLNPDVAPRMRGVAEKCNFCHGRLQAAQEKAAAEGRKELAEDEYQTACTKACPAGAITFGNLLNENSRVSQLAKKEGSFRLGESLGTEPKVYYRTEREWVRQAAAGNGRQGVEVKHG